MEIRGCLTQRGKLKATKCRRHVASDIKAMQHGCHYIWRLDQYKRRWKKENPSSMANNWWAFAQYFSNLFVCVCVCQWMSSTTENCCTYKSSRTVGIHRPYTATAGSGVKVEEERGEKRQIYSGMTEAEKQGATSQRPLCAISSWSTWHLN